MNPEFQASEIYEKNYNTDKKIVINRGGTRSGKTYSLCQLFVVWLFTGKISADQEGYDKTGTIHCVRKNQTTLESSVMRDLEEILHDNDLYKLLTHNKQKRQYIYENKKTGEKRMIELMGADDQQKLRGVKRDYLYCNEANELNYDKEFFQLLMRTKKKVFIDFNPDDEEIWINTELEQKRRYEKGDVEVIVSTYKDNPFLPKEMVEEIELLEKTQPEMWQIYGLGEYGKITGLVYEHQVVEEIPMSAKLLAHGLDFGYTNDPTALVAVYKVDSNLYLDEIMYSKGLTNTDICDQLDVINFLKNDEIVADCAEPKSIEEIFRRGYNIKPCSKGKDSISYGIDLLKQQNIFVTERSVNIIKELKHYRWDENKEGQRLQKPVDDWNHALDAVRYVCMKFLKTRPTIRPNLSGYIQQEKLRRSGIKGY